MKAAVLEEPYKLRVAEVPTPKPAEDEVLVRVKACGICGSDIRYLHGENPWSWHTLGYHRPNPPNMILGHEFAGEIVEVGTKVSPERIGQRILALPFRSCETCYYCQTGKQHLCAEVKHHGHGAGWEELEYNPGGMAEFCTLWSDKAYSLPDNISFEEAALLDGLGVAIHALELADLFVGDDILVMGTGPIGLSIIQTARGYGVTRVFTSDIYDSPLKLAKEFGADYVVNANRESVKELVMDVTNGLGINAVFNTIGSPESVLEGMELLKRGGHTILLAGLSDTLQLTPEAMSGERSLITAANYAYADLFKAIKILEAGMVKMKPIITNRYPLDEVVEAFEVIDNKEKISAIKAVIFP